MKRIFILICLISPFALNAAAAYRPKPIPRPVSSTEQTRPSTREQLKANVAALLARTITIEQFKNLYPNQQSLLLPLNLARTSLLDNKNRTAQEQALLEELYSVKDPEEIARSVHDVSLLQRNFENVIQGLVDANYDFNKQLPYTTYFSRGPNERNEQIQGTIIEYLFGLVPNVDPAGMTSGSFRQFINEFTPEERAALKSLFERSDIPANFSPDINILGDIELVETLRAKDGYNPDIATIQQELDYYTSAPADLKNRAQSNLQLLVK